MKFPSAHYDKITGKTRSQTDDIPRDYKVYRPEDVRVDGNTCLAHLDVNSNHFLYAPLWWQAKGLSQTASGYGRRLTTTRKIYWLPPGKKKPVWRRIYCTCFSNSGSCWFLSPLVVGGPTVRIFVG